jgi:hypothetical protein
MQLASYAVETRLGWRGVRRKRVAEWATNWWSGREGLACLAGFGPSGGILNGLGPSRLLLDFGGELMMMNTRGPEMGFRASAFGDDGGID